MIPNELIQKLKEGKCILFLGAGVHRPPPKESPFSYPDGLRPPIGKELAVRLAKACELAKRYPNETDLGNLARVSWFFEWLVSRSDLVNEIRDAVDTGKEPSPALRALAEMNFPLIITTNYDHLIENALRNAGKSPIVGIYDPGGAKPTLESDAIDDPKRPYVIKIHGDIDYPDSLVVTDEDYIQFILRMNAGGPMDPIPEIFRFSFKRWPTLFIGYSLLDYNLRLLFKTLRWKIDPARFPVVYSVDLYPDPLILDTYESQRRYVKFLVQDLWAFIPELYQVVTGKPLQP